MTLTQHVAFSLAVSEIPGLIQVSRFSGKSGNPESISTTTGSTLLVKQTRPVIKLRSRQMFRVLHMLGYRQLTVWKTAQQDGVHPRCACVHRNPNTSQNIPRKKESWARMSLLVIWQQYCRRTRSSIIVVAWFIRCQPIDISIVRSV